MTGVRALYMTMCTYDQCRGLWGRSACELRYPECSLHATGADAGVPFEQHTAAPRPRRQEKGVEVVGKRHLLGAQLLRGPQRARACATMRARSGRGRASAWAAGA